MPEQIITAYEDLSFMPLAEGSPVQIAVLWGNPETGPATLLVRFPEGYQEPWHTHSQTYQGVIVKGQFKTRRKENGEVVESDVFGPGAHIVQEGGCLHSEVNAGSGDMVALVHFDGPVDVVLADQ